MTVVFKEIFRVNKSLEERGYVGKVVGYFTDKEQAHHAAKGQGWYGGLGFVTPITIIQISDQINSIDNKLYELATKEPIIIDVNLTDLVEKKRQEILAKLTPEDIAFLGIKK